MSKIRVIMTGPMPPVIGGMSTVLQDLQNSSLSQQVELEFFNTFKTTPEGRSLFTAVKSKLALWVKWSRMLQGKQKTIVHIHTCSGFTFFLDSILVCLAKLHSRPVVLHIHGARFDQFIDSLNPILFKCVQWVMARCSNIIVLSESWQQLLQEKLGIFPFVVVENGVPIPIASSKNKEENNKDEVQVLFLGNLTERKGVWDLIQAMPDIEGAILNFVGGEEDVGIFDEVTKLVGIKNLEKKIVLHGPQYGEAKNEFLRTADIFVLPSYAEGLPISLLEAMANGLPVVVTPVGGIPAVITDHREGLIVNVGQVEEMVDALNTLIGDRHLRQKMGTAARKRCEEKFGIEATVGKLLTIYSKVF